VGVSFQDYYETLGVQRGAAKSEIKKAYRKLAKKYHPDSSDDPKSEDRFKEINEAYEVLGNDEKRKRYDALGANWNAGQDFRPPPGFENVRFEFNGGGAEGMSDFFRMIFGGMGGGMGGGPMGGFRSAGGPMGGMGGFGGPGMGGFQQAHRPRPRKGRNHEVELDISVEEAFHGGKKSLALEVVDPGGSRTQKTYQVKLPVGVKDGTRIRLGGQGGKGSAGGADGDLLLKVRFRKHPRYEVKGHDLTVKVPLAPWEAALGTKVPLQTLDGEVKLTIPAGSQGGQKLRLKGRGLKKSEKDRGDLFARLEIAVPKSLSEREKELFEQLAEASEFDPRE
jgi:curved DNA-binding protein